MLSPKKPIFASFRRIMVGHHDTEGYASLHPRLRATRFDRAFDLSGRAAVFMICFGVFFLAFETEDVGCVVVEVCFDDDFC